MIGDGGRKDGGYVPVQALSSCAHEMRTHLTGLTGMLELLAGTALDDSQRNKLTLAQEAAKGLFAHLNEILDYSRAEGGRLALTPESVNPKSVMSGAVELFRASAERKKLSLRALTDSSVPLEFVMDGARVRQVLMNLIGNAIKFTNEGGVTVTASAPRDGWLRFAVADTGLGIAADEIDRLFKPYSQTASASKSAAGGSGLGLAICKSFIESMEGSIGVESEPGKGSTFWVEFPQGESDGLERPAPEAKAAPVAPAPVPGAPIRARVLVAEDNVINQQLITLLLQRDGHTVTVTPDGAKALTALEGGAFDIVLMDIQMPVMDGIAATREIRARGFAMPVFAVTANASADDREGFAAMGFTGIIPKPIDVNLLRRSMAEALDPAAAMRATA